MARSDPQLNFRIPIELRDRLEAAAKESNRSLTGELIARLETSFAPKEADALPYRMALMLATRWIDNKEARDIISELLAAPLADEKDEKLSFFIRLLELEGQIVRRPDTETVDEDGNPIRQLNFAVVGEDGKELPVRISGAADQFGFPIVDKDSRLQAGVKNAVARGKNPLTKEPAPRRIKPSGRKAEG